MLDTNNEQFRKFEKFCRDKAKQAPHRNKNASSCPHCFGDGYVRGKHDGYDIVKKCICRKQKDVAEAVDRANIPNIFRNATLQQNPEDGRTPFKPYGGGSRDPIAIKSQENALAICRNLYETYADVFLNGRPKNDLYGLLLYGDCGRGKTRLACSLLNDLIHRGLTDVKFVEYGELFKQIRFSFEKNEYSYQRLFEGLIGTKVLVIDDFGTEVSNNLVWVLDNIGYIINERYETNLPTILTCNFWTPLQERATPQTSSEPSNVYEKPSWELRKAHESKQAFDKDMKQSEDLSERINYRLRSRIAEMCYELKVEGYDYRRRLSKQRELRMELERRKK